MGVSTIALLAGLLAVATVSDIRERRIPNWLTFGGLGLALALSLVALVVQLIRGDNQASAWLTTVPPADAVWGMLVTGFLPLVLYVAASGGAGDVKLAWALGALLGWREGTFSVLIAYVVAGCAGLIWLIVTGRLWGLIVVTVRSVGQWLFPGRVSAPEPAIAADINQKMGMAPFFAVGVLLVLYERVQT